MPVIKAEKNHIGRLVMYKSRLKDALVLGMITGVTHEDLGYRVRWLTVVQGRSRLNPLVKWKPFVTLGTCVVWEKLLDLRTTGYDWAWAILPEDAEGVFNV